MGDPLTAAAGLAVLDVIENEHLVEQARIKGQYLKNKLLELKEMHPIIGDVRGRGLLLGIEFVKDPISKEPAVVEAGSITAKCLELGLLIDAPGGAKKGQALWRIAPPITITYNQIDSAVDIIDEAIKTAVPKVER
jgi:2,2-dialkylglycine decarboxylase (pyruvate)